MRIMESPSQLAAESRRELFQYLRLGMLACGAPANTKDRLAEAGDVMPRVKRMLTRSYVGPIDGAGLTSDDGALSRAFDDIARSRNVIVSAPFRPAPLNTAMTMRVGVAAGSAVAVGAAKPLLSLTLSDEVLTPRKSVAIVVTTKELVRQGGPRAESLLNSALIDAESVATNTAVAEIIAASTSLTVAGTPANFLQVAMGTFAYSDASSRYIVLCGPDVARILCGYSGAVPGGLVYPNMSVGGGQIGNFAVYVCEGGLNAGEALVVDASAFAADAGTVLIDFSTETSLEMDDAPSQTFEGAVNMVSMFQTNSVAAKAERTYGIEPLRDDAAVLVTGISLGA